jgi:hypothetical protein
MSRQGDRGSLMAGETANGCSYRPIVPYSTDSVCKGHPGGSRSGFAIPSAGGGNSQAAWAPGLYCEGQNDSSMEDRRGFVKSFGGSEGHCGRGNPRCACALADTGLLPSKIGLTLYGAAEYLLNDFQR